MHTRSRSITHRVACSIVCVAILAAPGACTSQRAWDDMTPGNSGPQLADVAGVVLGAAYLTAYFFAQCASGGSGTGLDEYSYAHQYRR